MGEDLEKIQTGIPINKMNPSPDYSGKAFVPKPEDKSSFVPKKPEAIVPLTSLDKLSDAASRQKIKYKEFKKACKSSKGEFVKYKGDPYCFTKTEQATAAYNAEKIASKIYWNELKPWKAIGKKFINVLYFFIVLLMFIYILIVAFYNFIDGQSFGNSLVKAYNAIIWGFGAIISGIKWLRDLWKDPINTILDTIWEFINVLGNILVSKILPAITNLLKDALGGVGDAAGAAGSWIGGAAGTVGDWIGI